MHIVQRLHETFQPEHYRLALDVSKRTERLFNGTVTIKGTSSIAGQISLHAKELTIDEAHYGDELLAFQTFDDQLTLSGNIPADVPLEITLVFHGTITDGMHGLYPCYFEVDGTKQELLATQFESHHAREVFPCVDEPESKATFDLTLITEKDTQVLSNMPNHSQSSKDEIVETQFATTPRMSTYLLAFVVGDLQRKTSKTKAGVEVSVWSTRAQNPESLDFPLDVAIKTIEFFDDYFGVPYPLPKADHIALPDFSSGAMENWGLITYREIALLVDSNSSVSMREYVATVIAHETSHQWFGNLVTMKWWDDLWLNESFATIMEYVAVDALYPQWQVWNTFASQETLSALRRDQLAGVQPVRSKVNHPDEISTLFDPSIVYAKGARLLKMLRSYIGEEAFRTGLSAYFKQHAYRNTVGTDLWRALSESSGKDIESFMTAWISQSGYPLIEVATTAEGYELTQSRFVIGETDKTSSWPIPLFATNPRFPELLTEKTSSFAAEHSFPFLNSRNDAHFIAQYDDKAWSLIIEALQQGQLNQVDRLAILHETSLLARGGKISTASLLPLLMSYKNEDSEPVWNIISMVIGDLKRFVENNDKSESDLKSLVSQISRPLYDKLGFDPKPCEEEQKTKLRATVIGLLAYADEPDIINRALSLFGETPSLQELPSETRGIILAIAAKHGTDEDFTRLLQAHDETTNAELRDDITSGLCSSRDESKYSQLIVRLTSTDKVKQQDLFRWYIYLLRNRHARRKTWQWMVDNWEWIERTFKGDKSYDDFARYSATVFSTRDWLNEYKTFFSPLQTQTVLKRAIEIGLIEIEGRVEWIERDKAEVLASLAKETQ